MAEPAKKHIRKIKPLRRNRLHKTGRGDLQDHIIGARNLRGKRLRRALRLLLQAAALLFLLAAGFFITETLLQVSELPPKSTHTATGSAQPTGQTSSNAAPAPAEKLPSYRALYAPLRMLDNRERTGRILEQVKAGGQNAAVILFKDKLGYLTYPSRLVQQTILKASRKARSQTEACLKDYKSAKVPVIGIMHCFRDPIAAKMMLDGAVLQKGTQSTPWTDAQGAAWLNPFSEAAQEYLLGIIRELNALGVNAILLDSVCFPGGDLTAAVFTGAENPDDPAVRNKLLRTFLQKAKAAAGDALLLCVMPAKTALDGSEDYGGDLWNSAADMIAVDVRDAPWALDADWGKAHPTVAVAGSLAQAAELESYLILEEETQG